MIRAALALTLLLAIAAALSATRPPPEDRGQPPRSPSRLVAPAVPEPPELEVGEINRQDRVSPARRRRESRIFDSRPLLSRLPLERAGIRIDLVGLSADHRTAVLEISPGRRSGAFARRIYTQALRASRDPGSAYELQWAR